MNSPKNTQPIVFQRIENALVFLAATALYFALNGELIKFLLILISVDLSIIGYLRGPRLGAAIYNTFHSYALPIICASLGIFMPSLFWVGSIGLIWVAHIGLDRTLGLGLKYPDDFKHTHLGWLGRTRKP